MLLPRLLVVLPELPDATMGGGKLLSEILEYTSLGWGVDAVVPVEAHLEQRFQAISTSPALKAVRWHVIRPTPASTFAQRGVRRLSWLPASTFKYANQANFSLLEHVRKQCKPDAELIVSSWALAAYRGAVLPTNSRLYMVNVDPAIVRYQGPSLKRKAATWLERPKVKRLCKTALRKAGLVGAISEADLPALRRLGNRTDILHVPPIMKPISVHRDCVEPYSILITTNFTYPQNAESLEWFFSDVWGHVDSRARLTVTGRDENGRLAQLCARMQRVAYAGCLDATAFNKQFSRASVVVNPTRTGSGFQIKLLDALARGVPIVSTEFSNRIGPLLPSSDNPVTLARLINEQLASGDRAVFDYGAYFRKACRAWDRFLAGEHPSPGDSA